MEIWSQCIMRAGSHCWATSHWKKPHTHLFLWIVGGTSHRLLLILYWPNNYFFYPLTLNLPFTKNLSCAKIKSLLGFNRFKYRSHRILIKSKAFGTARNYLEVSNNRDCGKINKNNASKNASCYQGQRRPYKIIKIKYIIFWLLYMNKDYLYFSVYIYQHCQ